MLALPALLLATGCASSYSLGFAVDTVDPKPVVDLPQSPLRLALELAPNVPEHYDADKCEPRVLAHEAQAYAWTCHVQLWRDDLAKGFAASLAPHFGALEGRDADVRLWLDVAPERKSKGFYVVAYRARLLDRGGAVLARTAGHAVSCPDGGLQSAVEELFEALARELFLTRGSSALPSATAVNPEPGIPAAGLLPVESVLPEPRVMGDVPFAPSPPPMPAVQPPQLLSGSSASTPVVREHTLTWVLVGVGAAAAAFAVAAEVEAAGLRASGAAGGPEQEASQQGAATVWQTVGIIAACAVPTSVTLGILAW